MRRLLRAFGRDAFRVELQRPFHRHDRALNRGLAALADRLGVPCVATGNVHAHTSARARLQDAFVAIREHTTLDASEPLRRGNHSHVLATPEAMAARFADHPEAVAETERLADTLRFDLTSDLGYRYPGAEDDGADRKLAEVCHGCFEARYPMGSKLRARGRRAPGGRAAPDRQARAVGLLPAAPRDARARPRRRHRGARDATPSARCCRPGAGAGRRCPRSSATSRASRTSTRSPTSCCSGASSTRRSRRCPTSTSTSRATCARSSSRACTTASGAIAPRSWPPSRPSARAAPSASWARRWACRRGRSSASRAARRAGTGRTSIATSPPRWGPVAKPRAAGAGWARWPRRRTACPATSPSTPAA